MMTLQTCIRVYAPRRYLSTIKTYCSDQNSIIAFFIKGYVIEKMVNCILVDDGSTVNILPLKTIKELWIPMDKLFLSHMMIQGFN